MKPQQLFRVGFAMLLFATLGITGNSIGASTAYAAPSCRVGWEPIGAHYSTVYTKHYVECTGEVYRINVSGYLEHNGRIRSSVVSASCFNNTECEVPSNAPFASGTWCTYTGGSFQVTSSSPIQTLTTQRGPCKTY